MYWVLWRQYFCVRFTSILSPASCLLCHVFCLLWCISCLLYPVLCLLPHVTRVCILYPTSCLLSPVLCLLPCISCLLILTLSRLLHLVPYLLSCFSCTLFSASWDGDYSSVGRASDWHATDTGWISCCGKGFFSQSQLLCRLSYSVGTPHLQSHTLTSVCTLKIL